MGESIKIRGEMAVVVNWVCHKGRFLELRKSLISRCNGPNYLPTIPGLSDSKKVVSIIKVQLSELSVSGTGQSCFTLLWLRNCPLAK
jgi:hypothetical protein